MAKRNVVGVIGLALALSACAGSRDHKGFVLDPTLTSSVTLVTCYPFYFIGSAPQRFIVHAQRVRSKKTPAGQKPAGVESRVASGR